MKKPRPHCAHRFASVGLAGSLTVALIPQPAGADDAARISRLETEIQQLRSQIDVQNRRILRLEAELGRRTGSPAGAAPPGSRSGVAPPGSPVPGGPQPWHAAAAWNRVAQGMNVAEVTAILGAPTSVESVGDLKSLIYRGTTPGGIPVQGHVNLRDDRVLAVGKPAFQATPNP